MEWRKGKDKQIEKERKKEEIAREREREREERKYVVKEQEGATYGPRTTISWLEIKIFNSNLARETIKALIWPRQRE